jgi:hypothetical protein
MFPNHYKAYLNTAKQLMEMGKYSDFETPEDIMDWWISNDSAAYFFDDKTEQKTFF